MGCEREQVWSAADLDGVDHPLPDDADANGCGWPVGRRRCRSATSGAAASTSSPSPPHDAPADRATGYAASSCAPARGGREPARHRHQHLQRVQHLGRKSLYTGGKECRSRRPFGRGMIDRGRDRTRRPQGPAAHTAARSPTSTGDLPGVPLRQRLPGFMGSAGLVHLRAALRRVGRARGIEFDYAVSSRPRRDAGVVDGYDLVLGVGHDEYWSAPASGHAIEAYVARRWQLRQPVRQHDVLAGPPGGRRRHDGLPQVLGSRNRPGRRHGCAGDDDRHVVRPVGRADRRRRSSAPARRTACTAASARQRRAALARSPSTATTTGCSPAPACATAICSVPTTASSATRPSAAGWPSTTYQLPVARRRRRHARRGRDRRVHPVVEPGDGRVPGVDRRARRPGRPRVHRLAAVRPRRRRLAGAVPARQRGDARSAGPYGDDGGEVVTIGSTDWVFGLAGDPLVGRVTRNILDRSLRP